ncbi:hypothetical protein [Clostridium folliculivorans]|uniref:Uncharacterized protein n=1 Tax=Clostridium folliculivorans TaxID=2886038 RepID=A0A9W6DB88_9CLOT|nr:hypothetical protein [Clostridium folliculivorans]GKU25458.1 hypothetical protein CFOLD11_22840 [Clostridium folliculivorans]GKU28480.1 hypothetical protein CFB3_05860 [Clostridium folliculivorans]
MGRSRTKIKVEVNYPTTEEGKKYLEEAKARAVLKVIRSKYSEVEVKLIIEKLKQELE